MVFKIKDVLLKLVTLILAYFLLLPCLLLILGINECIRLTLKIYFLCSGSKCELISDGIENIYPTVPNVRGGIILGILVSPDNTINLQKEQSHFLEAVLQKSAPNGSHNGAKMYERLEKLLDRKWGYGCRRREQFNIQNHVKLWTETSPVNGQFYTEQEFFEGIIPKLSEHMDYTSKPGWEWVIIPNVQMEKDDNNLSTVRVFRCHHSYMDGISVGLLITECLMDFHKGVANSPPPFILDPKAKLPRKIRDQALWDSVRGLVALPYYMMKVLIMDKITTEDPISSGQTPTGLKHYGISKKMDLNFVREIRTKLGGSGIRTTNVLASIVISAIVQFLTEKGKLTGNSTLGMNAPTGMVPYRDSRPQNRVLPPTSYLPLRKTAEMELVEVAGSGKYSYPIRYFLLALGRFPQCVFQWVLPRVAAKFPCSTIFTAVPSTKFKGSLQIGGGFVSEIGGWSVVSSRIGLSTVVVSYGEELRFWCVVDDSVMNRVEFDRFLELLLLQKVPQTRETSNSDDV